MGRQINFYLHWDDQADFDKLLKSFGDIVLLPYYHYDNKVSIAEDTIVRDLKKEGNRIYLIRRKDFKNIPLTHIKNFGYWLIEDKALPVVHFDRCVMTTNKMETGRIYFQTYYLNSDEMKMVNMPDEFIRWGDKIINTIRRKLKKYNHSIGTRACTEYVGEHALQWLTVNRAVLAQGGLTSTTRN